MSGKPQCRLAEKARILTVKTDTRYFAKGGGRLYFCILFCRVLRVGCRLLFGTDEACTPVYRILIAHFQPVAQ